jgi:archaetidylinositol phosphate synthase
VTNWDLALPEQAASTDERWAGTKFKSPNRIHGALTANSERRLLRRLCRVVPQWVAPDHLTALGVVGAAMAWAAYVASNWQPAFFIVASLGLVVNWFGDSLDGSLARYRKIERPRYGYFIDHSVDGISALLVLTGLGLSPYVRLDVALFALVGYLLLGIYVFLVNHVRDQFHLSFMLCGPTEVRLALVAFNLMMYLNGPAELRAFGSSMSVYSVTVAATGAVLVSIFVRDLYCTARTLRKEDWSVAIGVSSRRAPDRV